MPPPDSPPSDSSPSPLAARCPGCGYNLSGTLESETQRCPECGRPWTIDELALQHIASSIIPDFRSAILWALGPGWAVIALILLGLLLGPPVLYLLFLASFAIGIAAGVSWVRDLYRMSFASARTKSRRILFMLGCLSTILAANFIQLVLTIAIMDFVAALWGSP